MIKTLSQILLVTLACIMAIQGQEPPNDEVARDLAHPDTRDATVVRLVSCGDACLPILLQWTNTAPKGVDERQLRIGLSDVFARLRTREAIPFLIRNISISRFRDVNTWIKAPAVIEERLPCVSALIQIGSNASDALMKAALSPIEMRDYVAVIYTISRIRDPRTRHFLLSTVASSGMTLSFAQEGLRRIDEP